MKLTNFASADLEPLSDLWVHSWQGVYPDIDFQARRPWFQAHLATWLKTGGLCRVMWLDEAIAGFFMLHLDTGHIDQICVSPASKGAGIAQALMEEARALSPSGLHLDVNTTNVRAISFYRQQGFVETGRGHNPSSGLAITFMAWAKRLHLDEIMVDLPLVQRLVEYHLPALSHLDVRPFPSGGTDNWLFRLGDDFAIRLPRRPSAAVSLEREVEFLGRLADDLSVPIPKFSYVGAADAIFAWPWVMVDWIPGETVPRGACDARDALAEDLGQFVRSLGQLNAALGPLAPTGARGAKLSSRDDMTRKAMQAVSDLIDVDKVLACWERDSPATPWHQPPVWFHGDLWGGNVLTVQGQLSGVIDFGSFGVGDPAVDLTPAWSLFRGTSRSLFLNASGCDADSLRRGRAWALSIALVQLPYYRDSDPALSVGALRVIDEVMADDRF